MKRCIILTGIKHAGKTNAARALALHVNAPFFDIDELIEKSVKMSCRELYTAHGQAAFQKEEFKACRLFCAAVKKYGTTGTESTASAKYTDGAETTDSEESTNGFDTQSVHQNGSAKTGCSLSAVAIAAAGGGICDNKKAFKLLHKTGFFIYLRSTEKILFERIISESKKTGSFPAYIDNFHRVYTRRDNVYKQHADSIIDVSELNKTKVRLAVYEAAQALLLGVRQTKP